MRGICVTGLVLFWVLWGAGAAFAQQSDTPSGFSELPPPCGTEPLAIAEMQWPSGAILAHIHALVLRENFGCQVDLVPGDLRATGSSLATTQQPAIVPEMWIARIPEIWNAALESLSVRQAGTTFSGAALEGWFVPQFVVDNNPGLGSVAALKDYWQVFRAGGERARFISCPPDWACAVLNRNLLRAHGLDKLFDIVEPASRFELDTLIGEAMSRREPILFYYWQPNAVMAQFAFSQLDMGGFDAEAFVCLGKLACETPRPSAFAPEPVVVALAEWVFTDAPQVARYFQRAKMPVAEMNALLAWQSEAGATAQETAAHFVAAQQPIWQGWISAP